MEEDEEYYRDLAFLHNEKLIQEEMEYEEWERSLQKPAKIEVKLDKEYDKIRVES